MEENKITSPLKAIRAFCLDCCGDNREEVANCLSPKCPLFEFRFGKNPYNKKTLTEEQRQAASERMKRAREVKK